jgi:hypothetical protein
VLNQYYDLAASHSCNSIVYANACDLLVSSSDSCGNNFLLIAESHSRDA